MKAVLQKIKPKWLWVKDNAPAIMAICAVIAIVISTRSCFLPDKQNEETYISRRPNVKIGSVYLKTYPYQETGGTQSNALQFFIPIRNDGETTGYHIEIKKKKIGLVRGIYDLNDSSLCSRYTSSPFDLKPRETIQDTIFIDESSANLQKVLSGNKSISLEYEIYFYADKRKKSEPFVYQYKIVFTKGQFQNDSVYENLQLVMKP